MLIRSCLARVGFVFSFSHLHKLSVCIISDIADDVFLEKQEKYFNRNNIFGGGEEILSLYWRSSS